MIAAEGEQKASRALKEASDVMAQSNVALQLRYLQVGTKYQVSSTKYQMMAQSNVALQLRYLQASFSTALISVIHPFFVDSQQHQHGEELHGCLSSSYRPLQKALPK